MPISGPDIVLYDVSDGIATITINREERLNAISGETFDRIEDQFRRFDRDPEAKVAILTGAGRAFSSGGDLKDFTERGVTQLAEFRAHPAARYPSASYAWEVDKPVIAAVNGLAYAGGFRFAQLCDLRIASDRASFGIFEAKVGRGAPWAMTLLWMVSLPIAMELLLTGEPITAQRAYEIGFVNKVVPHDELMGEARKMAGIIRDNAPITVRCHKAMMYRGMDAGRTVGAMVADDICKAIYTSKDAQEGQRAFAERRPPVWRNE